MVPPHVHRSKHYEQSIQTSKKTFQASLASCDTYFSLLEQDWLLSQANSTLNMLQASQVNLQLSEHAYLFGELNFNGTPLAQSVTKVIL